MQRFIFHLVFTLVGVISMHYSHAQVYYHLDSEGLRLYPQTHQLYPRNNNNQAIVTIQGSLGTAHASVEMLELIVHKKSLDGTLHSSQIQQQPSDTFHFTPTIEAGMYLYSFELKLWENNLVIHQEQIATQVVCGDVYIVSGQSNATGAVNGDPTAGSAQNQLYQEYPTYGSNQFFSKSLGKMPPENGINGATTNYKPYDNQWLKATATSHQQYGFVGHWALKLQYLIQHHYQMPTCIINGAYGGSSINQHMISASPNQIPMDLTTLFGALNYRVEQAQVKNHIKGLIWYQGETQVSELGAHSYTDSLLQLMNGWETHLGSIDNFYVVQLHTGCNGHGFSAMIREQQRTIQRTTQAPIKHLTANGIGAHPSPTMDYYWNCHFLRTSYNNLADRIFQLIGHDFYDNTTPITSPNIVQASYQNNQIIVEFDQPLAEVPEGLEQFFVFHQQGSPLSHQEMAITAITVQDHQLQLTVSSQRADAITYLLSDDPIHNNQMIWLTNPAGYSAFSFYQFPIQKIECPSNTIFSLHPNPIHNSSLCSINSCHTNNILKFYNTLGQLIYELPMPFKIIETTLNLEHLQAGIYLAVLENKGQIIAQQKLIKY